MEKHVAAISRCAGYSRPFTVGASSSLSSALDPFGAATARPNIIGSVVTPGNVDCWFYNSRQSACGSLAPNATDFFQLQQPGQLGNSGRNILRGPNTRVFDFSLQRDFPIQENTGLEFDPRVMQFALRLKFWSE